MVAKVKLKSNRLGEIRISLPINSEVGVLPARAGAEFTILSKRPKWDGALGFMFGKASLVLLGAAGLELNYGDNITLLDGVEHMGFTDGKEETRLENINAAEVARI